MRSRNWELSTDFTNVTKTTQNCGNSSSIWCICLPPSHCPTRLSPRHHKQVSKTQTYVAHHTKITFYCTLPLLHQTLHVIMLISSPTVCTNLAISKYSCIVTVECAAHAHHTHKAIKYLLLQLLLLLVLLLQLFTSSTVRRIQISHVRLQVSP